MLITASGFSDIQFSTILIVRFYGKSLPAAK